MTGIFSLLFEHVFTLKTLLKREKRDFDDSEIVSFFSLQESYKFLISTCYLTHLHGLSAENLILDLLISAISI